MSDQLIRDDCMYTRDHVWVRKTDNANRYVVGLTPVAATALGEIVFVKTPETGLQVVADESVCEVEAAKAMSDVYAPISGEIVDVNADLRSDPGLLNRDSFDDGWIFEIESDGGFDGSDLLDSGRYRKLVEGD